MAKERVAIKDLDTLVALEHLYAEGHKSRWVEHNYVKFSLCLLFSGGIILWLGEVWRSR